MSPNDNRVSDKTAAGALKDRKFGGNRKVTDNVQKAEDYTKPSLERRANLDGEVESELIAPDATKDIVGKSKNPSTQARQTAQTGFVNGLKVKSISSLDSSKLRIKTKKFN